MQLGLKKTMLTRKQAHSVATIKKMLGGEVSKAATPFPPKNCKYISTRKLQIKRQVIEQMLSFPDY